MSDATETIELQLLVADPELCAAHGEHQGGREPHDFPIAWMKIGALALG